jgi:hypothetical protein
MDIKFIGETQIAIVDDLVDVTVCDALSEMSKWCKAQGLVFRGELDTDDHIVVEDGTNSPPREDDDTFWLDKNTPISELPQYYQDLARIVSDRSTEAVDAYFALIGQTLPYREINLDVIHIFFAGEELEWHMDCFDYSLVFYLNDRTEWEGGDLYYPELDIKLSPVKNRLVIQPSRIPHLVTKITGGLRTTMTTFIPIGDPPYPSD